MGKEQIRLRVYYGDLFSGIPIRSLTSVVCADRLPWNEIQGQSQRNDSKDGGAAFVRPTVLSIVSLAFAWGILQPFWGHLGPFWGHLRAILGALKACKSISDHAPPQFCLCSSRRTSLGTSRKPMRTLKCTTVRANKNPISNL